ncbi:MAG: addiction module protein [Desulfobacteraceae bacterium 4572_35.1]|nr:MAG: addiction module protein [Desulfobacteraceae bacterium 4572_35.1]
MLVYKVNSIIHCQRSQIVNNHNLPLLPKLGDIETIAVLKQLARSHQALAELKGVAQGMPNQGILVSTLSLQEAKDSSEIENIITTQDEVYRSDYNAQCFLTLAAKEVHHYANALRDGYEQVQRTGLLTSNDIQTIQAGIENNAAGFRKVLGTVLKDTQGDVIYTPPQHPEEVLTLMDNLTQFINEDTLCDWDPLTKMAVIHHQFESIHPFYDGNGRTGRVINILYLVQQGLLDTPILYLSRYINQQKSRYYQLLQEVRDTNDWQSWLLFMLIGVEQTAQQTTRLIVEIKIQMQQYKQKLREQLPKIYSQDLVNNLFRHPYTKIDFVQSELQVTRQRASRYLDAMVDIDLVSKHKIGKENYYLNDRLFVLLSDVGSSEND